VPVSAETYFRDATQVWSYLNTVIVEKINDEISEAKKALLNYDLDKVEKHVENVISVFESSQLLTTWQTMLSASIPALRAPPEVRSDLFNNLSLHYSIMSRRYTMPKIEPELILPP